MMRLILGKGYLLYLRKRLTLSGKVFSRGSGGLEGFHAEDLQLGLACSAVEFQIAPDRKCTNIIIIS